MTYEEAKEKVKDFCVGCKDVTKCDDCEFPIIYKAIEKQIPKKAYRIHNVPYTLFCPSCDEKVAYNEAYEVSTDYCWNCGQALKWSDEE